MARLRGGGSIAKRVHPNGLVRWRATLDLPPEPGTHIRRRKRQDFPTRRDAQAALAQWQVDQKHGTLVDRSEQTVEQMMLNWLDTHARHKRPKTYEDYTRVVRLHIIPYLGAMKVQDLQPEQVQQWWVKLLKGGKGKRVVWLAHLHLKQALDQAVLLGLAPRNVAARVGPPKQEAKEMETWTAEEAQQFLAVADEQSAYRPIWRISLSTGMRRGELLGLRWQDVDWNKRRLRVRQTVGLLKRVPTIGPPKTKSARRDVPVEDDLLAILRAHRTRQATRRLALGPIWQDHDLVLPSEIGTPVNPCNLTRDYNKLIKQSGVRRIRIHDQRHTAITWAVEDGAPLNAVAKMAGHAQVTTTAMIYAHVTPRMERETSEKIARRLVPPTPTSGVSAP